LVAANDAVAAFIDRNVVREAAIPPVVDDEVAAPRLRNTLAALPV
jgi:hypothetical protein